jgi:hypothetical protein
LGSVDAGCEDMVEPFKRGTAEILGIYGYSARGNPPKDTFTCDINQVPSMFFDYRCIKTGQLTFGIFIDDIDTGDIGGTKMETVGDIRPFHFWVPQKVRSPGSHRVTVKYGHLETPPDKIIWDGNSIFTLILTGSKME